MICTSCKGLQSMLIFSILNHPCSFMVFISFCFFFYLSKLLFSRFSFVSCQNNPIDASNLVCWLVSKYRFLNLVSKGHHLFVWHRGIKTSGELEEAPVLVTTIALSTHVQKPLLNLNACAKSNRKQ